MKIRAFLRFLSGVVAAAIVAHLLTAVVGAAMLHLLHSHRIFDVRLFSDDGVTNFRLIGSFMKARAKRHDQPLVVFAGSSVTYGHLWHERVTFAGLFAQRHSTAQVLNASIIAADVSAMNDWIVCAARRNQLTMDSIMIELPVVNSLSYLVSLHHAGVPPAPLSNCEGVPDLGYFGLTATTFRGTGWVRLLANRSHSSMIERPISIGPVPKGYFSSPDDFAAVKADFNKQVVATLTNAQTVAGTVYAFPSPVFIGGLLEVGEDPDAVRDQLQAALAACQSVPNVRCIDPTALYTERGYYDNFTHLNMAGHRAMADLIDTWMGSH